MNETPVNRTESIPINTTPVPIMPDEKPKKKNYLPWILGILVLVIVLITSFLILTNKSKSTPAGSLTQPPVSEKQTTPAAPDTDISNWKTYTNTNFGFTLKYPSNWTVNVDNKNVKVTIKADQTDDLSQGVGISNLDMQNYISLDNWFAKVDKDCERAKQLSEKTGGPTDCIQYKRLGKRQVNQFAASKILWNCCGSGPTVRYFIEALDKTYFIDLFQDRENFNPNTLGDYDENNDKLARTYQHILSSFQIFTKTTSDDLIKFVQNRLNIADESLISVEKIEGNYAYGTGGAKDGAGFYWAAAKKDRQWNYAFGGNGIPDCFEVEAFPVGTFGGKFDECYKDSILVDRKLK